MKKILNQQDMKDINLNSILRLIRRSECLTRRQIEAALDLSWGAVSGAVSTLLREGYIKEVKISEHTGAGRTPIGLAINPHDHLVLGLDVNRSGLTGVVTDQVGNVLFTATGESTAADREAQITEIALLIRELLDFCESRSVLALGIAMQGAVDSENGISAKFPVVNWENVPLAALLSEKFGLPVFLEHDPDCILYAASAALELQDAILLRVDKGIGMAVMLEGRIFKRFGAFELGYTVLGDGRQLNDAVTISGLSEAARMPFADLTRAAREGDSQALAHFKDLAKGLGTAIVNTAQLFHINDFLLCGKMMEHQALFWDDLTATATRCAPDRRLHLCITDVKKAAVGAALLAAARHEIKFE